MYKIFFSFFILFLFSCKSKNTKPPTKTVILPYTVFINDECDKIKDTNKIEIQNIDSIGKVLSITKINKTQFLELVKQFKDPDISTEAYRNNYVETIYEDETNNSFNFSYVTNNSKLPVQNLIITNSKDSNSNLMSIFIKKQIEENNEQIIQNLFWKADEYFQINTFKKVNNQNFKTVQKVIWNK